MLVKDLLYACQQVDPELEVGVQIVLPGDYVTAFGAAVIRTVFSHNDMAGNPIYTMWNVRKNTNEKRIKRFFVVAEKPC
jgi:hypothetical protein